MSRVLAVIQSSHPEPGGAVTVAMTLLAVGVGHRGWAVPGIFLAVGATQLAVGWVNDWLYAARDRQAGRGGRAGAGGGAPGGGGRGGHAGRGGGGLPAYGRHLGVDLGFGSPGPGGA